MATSGWPNLRIVVDTYVSSAMVAECSVDRRSLFERIDRGIRVNDAGISNVILV